MRITIKYRSDLWNRKGGEITLDVEPGTNWWSILLYNKEKLDLPDGWETMISSSMEISGFERPVAKIWKIGEKIPDGATIFVNDCFQSEA